MMDNVVRRDTVSFHVASYNFIYKCGILHYFTSIYGTTIPMPMVGELFVGALHIRSRYMPGHNTRMRRFNVARNRSA